MSWPTQRLGELAEFRNGLNFAASDRGGDLPIVGVGDFGRNRLRGSRGLETVRRPPDLAEEALLKEGDLLFVRSNGNPALVGRCMLVEALDVPTTHSGFTIRARIASSTLDARWVASVFESGLARRSLGLGAFGTNISNLSQGILADVAIPLPPADVQQRSLAFIARFVEQTTLTNRLLIAKHALRCGLMEELLSGRRRLPAFRDSAWDDASLGELFTERNETGYPGLRLLSVTADRGLIPRDEVERKDTSNADKSKYQLVRVGDIAYNTMRMWQGVSALSALEGIVSPAYTVLVPRGPMLARYARHVFKLPLMVHTFWRHSKGLVDDTLSLKYPSLARILVRYPADLEEQSRIADIIDGVNREIALLGRQYTAIESQKRALMQRLLVGGLIVPRTEPSEPESVHA